VCHVESISEGTALGKLFPEVRSLFLLVEHSLYLVFRLNTNLTLYFGTLASLLYREAVGKGSNRENRDIIPFPAKIDLSNLSETLIRYVSESVSMYGLRHTVVASSPFPSFSVGLPPRLLHVS
jgi:hypothetical protein